MKGDETAMFSLFDISVFKNKHKRDEKFKFDNDRALFDYTQNTKQKKSLHSYDQLYKN